SSIFVIHAFPSIPPPPLAEGLPFPMEKYGLLAEQLVDGGTCTKENFFEPKRAANEDILRVHTAKYLKNLKELTIEARATRKTGFPLSAGMVEREIKIAGGTIQGCEYAREFGIAFNIDGGAYHAYE